MLQPEMGVSVLSSTHSLGPFPKALGCSSLGSGSSPCKQKPTRFLAKPGPLHQGEADKTGEEGRALPKARNRTLPLGLSASCRGNSELGKHPSESGASRERGWGSALATGGWQDTAQQLKMLHLKKTQDTRQVPCPIILFLCS